MIASTLGWTLAAALMLGAPPAAPPVPAAPSQPAAAPTAAATVYTPTRADLALAYLRFERALAAHPPEGVKLERISRGFDIATGSFFRGGFTATVRQLDAITASLLPERSGAPPEAQRRLARSVRAAVEPVVFRRGTGERPALRFDRLYDLPARGRGGEETFEPPVQIVVRIVPAGAAGDDGAVYTTSFPLQSPSRLSFGQGLKLDTGTIPVGAYDVRIGPEGDETWTTARWFVVDCSLDKQRELNAQRVAGLEKAGPEPALADAIAAFRSRNALLTDTPSASDAAQFMADQPALAAALERELSALEAGENPYRGHAGDLWRTIAIADAAVPVRIYSPPAPTPAGEKPALRPLVIALHGAGGDENMFMDAYGAGAIKSLADRRGFIVASPRNTPFAADPIFFDGLVSAMSADYPIDPSRIYVVGHSMGGGITAAWSRVRPDRIAAAATIAGFAPARSLGEGERMAPMLALAAENDGIIPTARVEPAARAAVAAGLPIDFRIIPHHAHTTIVGAVLPEVVEWLLNRRLEK